MDRPSRVRVALLVSLTLLPFAWLPAVGASGGSGASVEKAAPDLAPLEEPGFVAAPSGIEPVAGALTVPQQMPRDPPPAPAPEGPLAKVADLVGSILSDLQGPGMSPNSAALGTTFQGVPDNFAVPPDTQGAVGPSHIVTAVNGGDATNDGFRIQTRAGVRTSGQSLNAFWGISDGSVDPRVKDLAGNSLATDNTWTFTTK